MESIVTMALLCATVAGIMIARYYFRYRMAVAGVKPPEPKRHGRRVRRERVQYINVDPRTGVVYDMDNTDTQPEAVNQTGIWATR